MRGRRRECLQEGMIKAAEKKLAFSEKRGSQGTLSSLNKERVYVFSFFQIMITVLTTLFRRSWVFREPVDPVLLGIPTYFDVILCNGACDPKTIPQRLDSDKYDDSIKAFEAHFELTVQNAMKFSVVDSQVKSPPALPGTLQKLDVECSWMSNALKKR